MIKRAYILPYTELVKFAHQSDETKFSQTVGKLLEKVDYILVRLDKNKYVELVNEEDIKVFYQNAKNNIVFAYFNGTCIANKGGIGALIKLPGKEIKISKYIGEATSNETEYRAVIELLKKAKELNIEKLLILGSSDLVINQLIGRYKIRDEKLKKLFNEVKELEKNFKEVRYEWIPRKRNREARKLSKMAIYNSNF